MLKFDLSEINGDNAVFTISEMARLFHVASTAMEEVAMTPAYFSKAGVEPESVYFGACHIMDLCASVLNHIENGDLVRASEPQTKA